MRVQPIKISPSLATIIGNAGNKSDVDFDYLVQTAVRESSLNPQAKASTSSAVGLFQFLEQTWFDVMKSDGARLGYAEYANAITRNADGELTINNGALRKKVLELREDPQIAADLAAAFTKTNGAFLKERFGRMPSAGELYIAHFMGAGGAEKLFEAGLKDPTQIAAELFPRQAKANPTIFYDGGQPRTIEELYRALVSKHTDVAPTTGGAEFDAQKLAAGGQSKQPLLPMSFKTLYSASPYADKQSPVAATKASGSFFSKIYEK